MGNGYTYKYFFAACNCDKLLDERQKAFFNLLITNKSNDNFTEQLSELIVNARHNTQWRKQYMDFEREQAYAREAGRTIGLEEGYASGIEEGRAEGRTEGARLKAKEDAKNFLKEGISVEIIARCTGLSVEEVTKLQEQ